MPPSRHRLAGDIATARGDVVGAELLYQEASGLDPDDLPAFEGLANLQIATHKVEQGAQTYSHLVRLLFLTVTSSIFQSSACPTAKVLPPWIALRGVPGAISLAICGLELRIVVCRSSWLAQRVP